MTYIINKANQKIIYSNNNNNNNTRTPLCKTRTSIANPVESQLNENQQPINKIENFVKL